MRSVIIMNSKGGCGKSTVATNLASRYAVRGYATALFDYDPQGSGDNWLRNRGPTQPAVFGVAVGKTGPKGVTRAWQTRLPPETRCLVMDTAANVPIADLAPQLRAADAVLIPILPSPMDIHATADFIRDLLLIGKLRNYNTRIGIVANRLRANTQTLSTLDRFLTSLDIPVVARLRDSQRYAQAVDQGLGVHEMTGTGAYGDQQVWDSLVDWIEQRSSDTLAEQFSSHLRSDRSASR